VLVIGSPEGLQGTVSEGIISAFRENRSLIQITAPISPGSSGSPVMNESGEVIGVATMVTREGQNLGFAIAVEEVERALTRPTEGIETPSESPSTDSVRPPESNAERVLRVLATEYIVSGNSPSIDQELALYADRVDYYDKGLKSVDEIRTDLSKYRRKWPSRHYEVSRLMRPQYDSQKDVGSVIVVYTFEVSNGGKRKTGEAETLLVFGSLLTEPRLILVREQIGG
jgi:hypothetical protein